jgi:hypothetical protein
MGAETEEFKAFESPHIPKLRESSKRRHTETKTISLIADQIWQEPLNFASEGSFKLCEPEDSMGFVQPLGPYEDLIFKHSYNALESLSYHRISPEKAKRHDDLIKNEIIRHYNCFEANDIEGFKSVLFLTPPTLLDDDQATLYSRISDQFSATKMSSKYPTSIYTQRSPYDWSYIDNYKDRVKP